MTIEACLLVRCLAWESNGELQQGDRDLIVSRLQTSDLEAGLELTRLLSRSELALPC